MSNMRKLATTALVGAGLLAGVTTVSAQQAAPTPAPPPAQGGMMDHQGMTMQGGGMMTMMEPMSKMVENCDRMMQSHMDRQNPGSLGQQPQGNRG